MPHRQIAGVKKPAEAGLLEINMTGLKQRFFEAIQSKARREESPWFNEADDLDELCRKIHPVTAILALVEAMDGVDGVVRQDQLIENAFIALQEAEIRLPPNRE